MRICSRPRLSSSVTRESQSSQLKSSKNINNVIKDNENQNENGFEFEKPKKNMRKNTQRRQLHPPNFQVSYNIQPTTNTSNNFSTKQFKENGLESSLYLNKCNKSSITRRSQSETRKKRETNSNSFHDTNRNGKRLVNKSSKEKDDEFYQQFLSNSNYFEKSQFDPQKTTSRYDEFQNSDGTIKKLSEKFNNLRKQPVIIKDEDGFSNKSSFEKTTTQKSFYFDNSKTNSLNQPISTMEISHINIQDCSNDGIYNNYKSARPITKDSYQYKSACNASDNNIQIENENKKVLDSIELAMDRIKKEMNPKGIKPTITKKKRALMNGKVNTSKSIDFEFLNDEPSTKEQINKSNIEKLHVSFMDSCLPPKKKNNEIQANSNIDQNVSKEFNEPAEQEKFGISLSNDYVEKTTFRRFKKTEKQPQNQELDEFMQIEKQMKEEVDDYENKGDIIPNFLKIIKILRDQLDKNQYQEVIRIMNQNKSKHFLLLLTQPLMNIDAVYIMRGDLKSASLLWGYGPKKVTRDMIDLFWKYNVTTKIFDDQQLNDFEPNLDAISTMRKY